MTKVFGISLVISGLLCTCVSADTIYIVGSDGSEQPTYWTISPPAAASSGQELDVGTYTSGPAYAAAFSSTQTVYIVGQVNNEISSAAGVAYWTVPPSSSASSLNVLDSSEVYSIKAGGIAFNSSGVGYIVGVDDSDNAAYWTVSSSGSVSGPSELGSGFLTTGVAFSSSGTAYVTGLDSSDNACYWTISDTGVVGGPFDLVGGGAGGVGIANAVAVSPSGTVYIVGATTDENPCYWTIISGSASSSIELEGGSNSQARAVAFLSSGAGLIVGQTGTNDSSYWVISSGGTVGELNLLTNGSGNASSAYGVAFSSDETAYIVGLDNSNNAAYWTVPISGSPVEYNVLESSAISYGIAIAPDPNPPTDLSGEYEVNDFALLYENCATLNWTLSDSEGIASYHIYKNGTLIATVSSSATQYENHNQNRFVSAVYTVTAVDYLGNESSAATVTLN